LYYLWKAPVAAVDNKEAFLDLVKRSDTGPNTKWTPAYLRKAADEARAILNDVQYAYVVQQILLLCEEEDPSHPVLLDVDAIEDFYELRDKGGVLGRINLRVYFWISRPRRMVVVLGVWKKEADGKTPVWMVRRMVGRRRIVEALVTPQNARKG